MYLASIALEPRESERAGRINELNPLTPILGKSLNNTVKNRIKRRAVQNDGMLINI